jgi:hypothetical protein
VEVAALVAHAHAHEGTLVIGDDALHPPHVGVQFRSRLVVGVIVDALKAEEQGDNGAHFGQKIAVPGAEPFVDRGEQPFPKPVLVETDYGLGGPGVPRDRRPEFMDFEEGGGGPGTGYGFAEATGFAERPGGGRINDHVALRRGLLGGGHAFEGCAGEHIQHLDGGIADQEPARGADGDPDTHGQPGAPGLGEVDGVETAEGGLHGQGAGDRPVPVVVLVPAGDGVTAEADHTAAEGVHFADDCREDQLQLPVQLLGAAQGTELVREGLGQRSES